MKLKLFSTLAFAATTFALNAQMSMPTTITNADQNAQKNLTATQATATNTVNNTGASTKTNMGTLVSQFTGAISPTALTDEFNKGKATFQSQAKSTTTTDVKGTSGLLQKLEGGLKTTSFTAGWAKIKDKWLSNVKTATTTKQLAGYLKTLTANVDPKFLGPTWEKIKPTFEAGLDKIAQ